MSKFDDFTSAVGTGAEGLAKGLFDDLRTSAKEDAQAFVDKTRDDLQRWTTLLARGDLTKRDFVDLVRAKGALAEMHALTQKGVLLTKLERFRTGLIDLIVDTAFKVFL